MNGTLAKLVDLSKSIAHHYRIGKLNATFIYEEFMQRVKSIPRCVDFSKVAKDNRVSMLAKAVAVYKDNEDIMSGDEKLSTVPKSDCKARNDVRDSVYDSWKLQQLKEECEKYGLPKTGKKADLISRLLGPRPPTAWLERKKANLYVPARYDTCGAAILVALWLHQRQHNSDSWKGLEKEEIIALAESLQISKDPFTGTGKGLFDYDGWSCMGPLREGQSPLVWRQKGGFFKLTTVGGGTAGYRVAEAMHDWCHQNKKCLCMENGLV